MQTTTYSTPAPYKQPVQPAIVHHPTADSFHSTVLHHTSEALQPQCSNKDCIVGTTLKRYKLQGQTAKTGQRPSQRASGLPTKHCQVRSSTSRKLSRPAYLSHETQVPLTPKCRQLLFTIVAVTSWSRFFPCQGRDWNSTASQLYIAVLDRMLMHTYNFSTWEVQAGSGSCLWQA